MIDKSLFTLPGAGRILGIVFVFGIVQALCVIGQAFGLAHALTNLWNAQALADQVPHIVLFFACFVGKQLVLHVQNILLDNYAADQAASLREQLLSKVFSTQAHVVAAQGTARVTTSALEGTDQVETYLKVVLPKILNVVVIPLGILIATLTLDWVSALIMLVMFPVIIFFMILIGKQAAARAEAQYATYHVMSNHFIDTLRGIGTLKVFGASRGFGKSIFRVSEKFREATIDTLKVATLSNAVLDLIATGGVAAVAIMLAFRLLDGSLPLFVGLAVLVLSPEYFKPIREFAGDYHASLDGKNALASINAIVSDDSFEASAEQVDLPTWDENASLSLNGIGYTYAQAAHPALEDVSFEVRGCKRVGIVGTSGSGKSTLVNLLGGFATPTQGSMSMCGTQLESLRQNAWQKQILYIPQRPYIFHASLRDNVAFYSPHATDDDVMRAVELTGLTELVVELEKGIHTLIGEGARQLSGGQAQRIALARALLDPTRRVLLFDEPTAHLDIETEYELKARMLPLMQDRLVFFATHRLHWLAEMDYILVLEEGRVVEAGEPRELLGRNGALRKLTAQVAGGEAV